MIVKHSKRTIRRACPDCGTTDRYLAHDTDKTGDYCTECKVNGPLIVVDKDGETPHADSCPGRKPAPDAVPDTVPVPGLEMPRTEVPVPTPAPDAAYAAFQALVSSMTPSVSRDEIVKIIKDEFNATVFPTRVVVQNAAGERKELSGSVHYMTAEVITDLMAGEHVMMVGPAGTGKSTIGEKAAEALSLPFYSISLSPQTPASALLGYMNATGDYAGTAFRQAYEHGGVFLLDEIDNGHPSILAVMNAGLSNSTMAFPDGMIKRHANFLVLASANTYGKGADRQYVGRQQLDAATLDRFTIETIEYDEALETEICHATGAAPEDVAKVLELVRKYRKAAAAKRMAVVMGVRASVGMCRLIAAGKTWNAALEGRVRRGMSDADWAKLNG